MAYDIAGNLQLPDAIGAFRAGQQMRQQNTLFQQQQDDRAAQQQAAQAQAEQAKAQQQKEWLYNGVRTLASVRNDPVAFARVADSLHGEALARGLPSKREEYTPEALDAVMAQVGIQAGVAPPAAAKPDPLVQVSPGGRVFARQPDGSLTEVANAPFKPDRPRAADGPAAPRFRTLTPDEVAAAGLPAGTSAQVDPNGKIQVLSKPAAAQTVSPKDASTARVKLNQVALARRQLDNIRQAFAGIQDSYSAGPGGGLLPTEAGRKFDAAVNQMRSTLTALTRVPGVGAMSDYETKLDQAKFPSRNDYEAVTAQNIDALAQLLDGIESGYGDILGSGAAPAATPAPAAAPAASGGEWVDLGNGIKVKRK